MALSGLPSGATGTFNPSSITGGTGSSTLTVSTSSSTVAGSYTLTITGTSGSLSHSVNAGLVLNPVGGGLPAGWSDQDIGSPGQAGSATFSGGTFTVSGGGSDIWGSSDNFNYAWQAVAGDITITARVASQQNTNLWAKSGVTIRETTAANAAHVSLYVTPGHGVNMQYRSATGATSVELGQIAGVVAPYWVQLVRTGNTFMGYSSADGVNWTQVGTVMVTMASTATAGLAVTAHNSTAVNTSTFDNVSVAGSLPAGWTDVDIGAPGQSGSASLQNGMYTVNGGGADIWHSADQFNYAYRSSSGDVMITAHVGSQQNTNAWAKSGVMIRETTAAGSDYVFVMVTPSNGVNMQYRPTAGGSSVQLAQVGGAAAPYWVRLVRTGNSFTGYSSADGVNWTPVSTISVSMNGGATVGLAVCAHDNTQLNTSTFDNVAIQ